MHPQLQRRLGILAVGTLVATGVGAGAFAAVPKSSSTIAGSAAWYTQAYENFPTGGYLTPQQSDVVGPQRTPFGTRSHQLTIGESSAQTELYRTDAYDDVPLANLSRLEYSELARPSVGVSDRQPVYLRLSVDTTPGNGTDTTDTSLFFYPANNGTVVNGQWQNWDVASDAAVVNIDGDGGATTTLAAFAADNPGAKLVNDPFDATHDAGAIALIAGGALGGGTDPQINGEYFVDRVIVGENDQDTLYDLGGGSEVNGGVGNLTVDPAHERGWKFQAYNDTVYLTSNQAFVDGPALPPQGNGSVQASLPAGQPDRVELFRTAQYDDILLRDLRVASYSTYVDGNPGNVTPQQPHYLRLSLDNDGDGTTDESLFYFPANNGTVQQNTWQSWDAAGGLWNVNGDTGQAAAVSLDDYLVAHPDSRIVVNSDPSDLTQPQGGVAFLVGGGGASQTNGTYDLDDITISTVDAAGGRTVAGTNFDLEPTLPTLAIGNASVSEGNYGSTLTFPVTVSRPVARGTTVHYATADGTATAGSDYRATSGTVTIPAGSTSGTVRVSVLSDKVRESNETLRVTLSSPVNATLADGSAVGTIVNDDTHVGIALRQATQHRVRVLVSTGPIAAGAPVTIYGVRASGTVFKVLTTTLSPTGRLSVRLAKHYLPGTKLRFVVVVRTANGNYSSRRAGITIA